MHTKSGFDFIFTTIKRGTVIDVERIHNLMPYEGLNYTLNAALKQGTQYPNFYLGLYERAYTPVPEDVMASFPTAATELTAYSETSRQILTLGAVSLGQCDNVDNEATFTGTTDGKLVYGGFVSSGPSKGSTTGVLLSAVRFPSPKHLDIGVVLKVSCVASIESI